MKTTNISNSTAAPIVPILGGANGSMGDAIQKLFAVNTVEELTVYKTSLQAQAAAVDDDVRIAIGQRYRDLLSTCEEVVGMEAVCRSVEGAKQRRQRQMAQMGAAAAGGGNSRFAVALRNASNQQQQSGAITPTAPAAQYSSSPLGALLASPRQQFSSTSTTLSSLTMLHQGLVSRMGCLQVLLQRCTGPTSLVQYAGRIDKQLAAMAMQQQQQGGGRAGSPSGGGNSNGLLTVGSPNGPLSLSRGLSNVGGAFSPSNGVMASSPSACAGMNPYAGSIDSLMAAVPPPPPTAMGSSLLFHHTATEHAHLLGLCHAFVQILRKIAAAPSSSSSTSGAAVTISGGALPLSVDESATPEKQYAAAMIQSVQQQLLSVLMPRSGAAATSAPSPARAASRAGGIGGGGIGGQRDIRSQLEACVVKAIADTYRKSSSSSSSPSTVASQQHQQGVSPSTAAATTAATQNALLLFYSDLHQALTVEEQLHDQSFAAAAGTNAGAAGTTAHASASPPAALRALLRLIDLQEAAMGNELQSLTAGGSASAASASASSSRKKAASVLASAKLCINGVNGLLTYLIHIQNAAFQSQQQQQNAAANGGAQSPVSLNPIVGGGGASSPRGGQQPQGTVDFLMGLIATTDPQQQNGNASGSNTSITNANNSPPTNASGQSPADAYDSLLDTLLVHACGGVDLVGGAAAAAAASAYSSSAALTGDLLLGGAKGSASLGATSAHQQLAGRIEQLSAMVYAPPSPQHVTTGANSSSTASGSIASSNLGTALLLSLGEEPRTFLGWSVNNGNGAAGGGATDALANPTLFATPQRGSVGGGWALSPSPRIGGGGVDASSSIVDTQSAAALPWQTAIARALGIGSAMTAEGLTALLSDRVKALQQFLATIMFGGGSGGASLLAILLQNPSASSSSSSVASPSGTIASARALQSLEALLLSLGGGGGGSAFVLGISTPSSPTPPPSSSAAVVAPPCVWDTVVWKDLVEAQLSTYVVGAVTAVIRSIAATAVEAAAATRAVSLKPHQSAAVGNNSRMALHSGADVGILSAPTAASAAASSASAAASVEANILSLIMARSSTSRRGQTSTPPPPPHPAANDAPPSSSCNGGGGGAASCAVAMFDLLEALAAILDRDFSSPTSTIRGAIQTSLSQDLLAVLEEHVGTSSSSSSSSSSPIPAMAPVIGMLIANIDLLLEKTTTVSASAAAVNSMVSPISATASGVFPNGLLGGGNGAAPSATSKAAVRFIVEAARPRLVALFVRCFEAAWLPNVTGRFRAMLANGWRSQLLGRCGVMLRHDYNQLTRIVKAAAKAKGEGRKGPRADRLAAFLTSKGGFAMTAKDITAMGAQGFKKSLQPLLWGTELVSGVAVAHPRRAHPVTTEALWWVQRTIAADLATVFDQQQQKGAAASSSASSQQATATTTTTSSSKSVIVDVASPIRLAALGASLLSATIHASLRGATIAAARQLCSEGAASRRRAASVEESLRRVFALADGVAAPVVAAAAVPPTAATAVAPPTANPPAAAVAVASPAKTDNNGWGDDEDDFELDYSDDDTKEATGEKGTAEEKTAEEAPAAAPAVAESVPVEVVTAPPVGDVVEDGEFADEDMFYNEFIQRDDGDGNTNSNTNSNSSTSGSEHSLELHGVCEEYFIQLAFDVCLLERALATASSALSPAPEWAQQCAAIVASLQAEVEGVAWSMAVPLVRRCADKYFEEGQLLWGVDLTAQSIAGRGWSQAATATAAPTAAGGGLGAVPQLLVMPSAEVERLPLLPVALPQAHMTLSMPPPPSSGGGLSGPSAGLAGAAGRVGGIGSAAAAKGVSSDDAASRLVSGATASLKSFLGGW